MIDKDLAENPNFRRQRSTLMILSILVLSMNLLGAQVLPNSDGDITATFVLLGLTVVIERHYLIEFILVFFLIYVMLRYMFVTHDFRGQLSSCRKRIRVKVIKSLVTQLSDTPRGSINIKNEFMNWKYWASNYDPVHGRLEDSKHGNLGLLKTIIIALKSEFIMLYEDPSYLEYYAPIITFLLAVISMLTLSSWF